LTVQEPYIYVHESIHPLHVLVCGAPQVDQHTTDDAWYAVTDDHELIVPHRGSVHAPVGGGVTIHEL
jgi:hypothetical protein